MARRKVLIIGAGIAGLSAGSYLQRNGYDTEIFEAHDIPGGLCTGWKRKGYTFDYCIHWLMGSKPGTGFDVMWDELEAFRSEDGSISEIRNFDEFSRMEFADGEMVRFFADADRLREELLRISLDDRQIIEQLIKELKVMSRFKIVVDTERSNPMSRLGTFLKNIPVFRYYLRHLRTPMRDFASKFNSHTLKRSLIGIIPPDWSLASLTMGLGMQHTQAAGYPVGGSLTFARNITRKYLSLGGTIHHRHRVDKILVRENRAIGLKMADGKEVMGDEIVSAADGHATLFDMLEGKYLTEKLQKAYETFPLFPSSIFLGLGVARDMSDQPHALSIEMDPPLHLPDGSDHPFMSVVFRHYDPTLAPKGKTSCSVILNTWNDQYWRDLAANERKAYDRVKEEIREQIIERLDLRFPGIRSDIEVSDLSTPHTVCRYTHNWHGSYEGFGPTPVTLMTRLPKTLPMLKGFSMIGQWTEAGGGIPPAGLDGRNVAKRLCKQDGKPFSGKA